MGQRFLDITWVKPGGEAELELFILFRGVAGLKIVAMAYLHLVTWIPTQRTSVWIVKHHASFDLVLFSLHLRHRLRRMVLVRAEPATTNTMRLTGRAQNHF